MEDSEDCRDELRRKPTEGASEKVGDEVRAMGDISFKASG
jgi:hypothetical protein